MERGKTDSAALKTFSSSTFTEEMLYMACLVAPQHFDLEDVVQLRAVSKQLQSWLLSSEFGMVWNKAHCALSSKHLLCVRLSPCCRLYPDNEKRRKKRWARRYEEEGALMAATYALMCFKVGHKTLLVTNPLTEQKRELLIPSIAPDGKICSAGIHFEKASSSYTLVVVEVWCSEQLFTTWTYNSVLAKWERLVEDVTDYMVKKCSPMVWHQGEFYWTAGEDLGRQLLLKLDQANRKWTKVAEKIGGEDVLYYGALYIEGDCLALTRRTQALWQSYLIDLVPGGLQLRRGTELEPTCFVRANRIGKVQSERRHCCFVEDSSQLFTSDYLSRRGCLNTGTKLLPAKFEPGLGEP